MRRIATALFAGTLVLTGCSEPEAEVTAEDIASLEQTLVHGSALSWELTQVETRVASMCMADLGFDVHDANTLHGKVTPGRFEGFASPYAEIPTVEQAEKFAFGAWVDFVGSDEAEAMQADPDFLAFNAAEEGWWDTAWDEAREEWEATDEEYQQAWNEAFVGSERAAYDAARTAASEEAEEDEEIDLGTEPPFGGCELETIEIVYGGPAKTEDVDGVYWSRPDTENPLAQFGDTGYEELSAAYADEEQAFLDCIEDRGHGEWEFDEFGGLPMFEYVRRAYPAEMTLYIPVEDTVPELTDEHEDLVEAEGPQAFEFKAATDFAGCAEDAGLRDGAEDAWARIKVGQIIDHEVEVYAWEQEIEEYLGNAQDYLAGN
ncbi:hypothetical protein [Glycomyces tritici]|uniref:Uncharacterized protein n=1 Tax=Glycomyces tritici TaxID=2665176 RepID=A0ABT7YLG0_9ACTN|nr:hypothetical protein [Glycomyces tritici]MDN3239118.1 hypothetical protein [Glycomyces tritici]MDN3240280.1 hypothetical protein [Glycomyces tritici]